jgi:hypothetical protein
MRQAMLTEFASPETSIRRYLAECRSWIPFRRGYLFQGPPGNGKTSVIRAMLNGSKLDGHSIALFCEKTDDDYLERMFQLAASNAPPLIVLEHKRRSDVCFTYVQAGLLIGGRCMGIRLSPRRQSANSRDSKASCILTTDQRDPVWSPATADETPMPTFACWLVWVSLNSGGDQLYALSARVG